MEEESSGNNKILRPQESMLKEIEELSELLKKSNQASSSPWKLKNVSSYAQDGADKLRDLRYRSFIGSETNLISNCLSFLKDLGPVEPKSLNSNSEAKAETIKQVMRVIGNLVHTHDVNRQKCIDGGASTIFKETLDSLISIKPISNLKEPFRSCLQILLVVTYNLCAEYSPAQIDLAESGLFLSLCKLVEETFPQRVHLCLAAVRLIEEMCSSDEGKKLFPESLAISICKPIVQIDDFINQHLSKPRPEDDDSIEVSIDIIMICSSVLELVNDDVNDPRRSSSWLFNKVSNRIGDRDQQSIISNDCDDDNLFCNILRFIRYSNPPLSPEKDEWTSSDDNNKNKNASNNNDDDDDSPKKVWEQVKARLGRSLVLGLSHIKSTNDAIDKDSTIQTMVDWLNEPDLVEERPDLVIIIGLSLGNLACDDTSSKILVEEYDIVPPLSNALKVWLPPISSTSSEGDKKSLRKGRPGEQAQVLHALCGLARNLSVSEPSKSKIGSSGIGEGALECLRPEFDLVTPLLGSALGLIRHLCRHNGSNVERLLESNLFESLIGVINRTDQPYLVVESCRVLSTIINTIGQLQQSTDNKVLKSQLSIEPIIKYTLLAANSKQMVLINESLVSLALLSLSPDLVPQLCKALIENRSKDSNSEEAEEDQKKDKSYNYRNGFEVIIGYWIPSNEIELKSPIQMNENCNSILISIYSSIIKSRETRNKIDQNRERDHGEEKDLLGDEELRRVVIDEEVIEVMVEMIFERYERVLQNHQRSHDVDQDDGEIGIMNFKNKYFNVLERWKLLTRKN